MSETRSLTFTMIFDDRYYNINSIAYLKAKLQGYDNCIYRVYWEYSEDGTEWKSLNLYGTIVNLKITQEN